MGWQETWAEGSSHMRLNDCERMQSPLRASVSTRA